MAQDKAEIENGLIEHEDGLTRCWWPQQLPDYIDYHDNEWGMPVADDTRLFEKLCLEGFQSGLSWLTILRKREGFREAFAGFDIDRVAAFGDAEIEACVANPAIVRHRGKIKSTVNNARRAQELVREFGSLAAYVWRFEPDESERPARIDFATMRTLGATPASTRMSKDLKKRGWSFVGPTTVYAFMQSMGMVNDHLEGCAFRERCEEARAQFTRPC